MAPIDLTRIGQLEVPQRPDLRWRGPTRSRLVRFVIQTLGTPDLRAVEALVARAFGQPGPVPQRRPLPRLVLPSRGGTGRFPSGGKVGEHLEVRALFPGAPRGDDRFKLGDYFVLSLPVTLMALSSLERPTQATLFEIASRIRQECGFVRVEPELFYRRWAVTPSLPAAPAPLPPPPGSGGPPLIGPFSSGSSGGSSGGSGTPPPATGDHAWNLRSINWPATGNGFAGLGITVGQVDTGSSEHTELAGVYAAGGRNVVTGSGNTTDPLTGPFPGHGTATASVLASRGGISGPGTGTGTTGPAPGVDQNAGVTGVANRAAVLPVLVSDSVVNVSNLNMAEGIWHCVQQGVEVISISLGGYFNQYLERVVSFAVFSDIIVVAAGGQYWPVVPAPAFYPDCIAATGSTVDKTRWALASVGPWLDIAAPAEHVWVADFDEQKQEVVRQSSGTSFAAPTVAGVAALWLAARGRTFLLGHYAGERKLAEVFRGIARNTVQSDGWDTVLAGPGIIDARAVVNSPLPLATTMPGRNWADYDVTAERRILRSVLGNPSPTVLNTVLSTFLNTTIGDIDARLDEVGTELLAIVTDSTEALQTLQRAVLAERDERTEDAAEAIDSAVDVVVGLCSAAAASVLGWFD